MQRMLNPLTLLRTAGFALVVSGLVACGGGTVVDDGPDVLEIVAVSQPSGGTTATFYSASFSAFGGLGTGFTWDLASGALPPGVTGLPNTGSSVQLSGVLGAVGTYPFTLRVRDASGAAATRQIVITIGAGGPGPGPTPGTNFATSMVNAPGGRGEHSAVWTGTEMIIWGGFTMIGPLNTGSAYNPTTDTWRTISSVGAPAGRFLHTAVWTGTEMVVFGGTDSTGPMATGGAYNPTTDTWRALPALNAPQARFRPTSVWTGNAAMVWGGQGVFPPPAPNSVDLVFGDGAAYDPVANVWNAVANGPAHRNHTMVWTGTQAIVWGGTTAFALSFNTINTGGIYTGATNQWVNTNVAGAPAARALHTAVWAGTQGMIVWGGTTNGVVRLATGGRLQPGTNTWQATSVAGAPSARVGHTAVWTGTEMAVFGGIDAAGMLLGDGGVYRPSTDTWRPMNPGHMPERRSGHTAVWTGTAMIVWGGSTFLADAFHSTGAVMFP